MSLLRVVLAGEAPGTKEAHDLLARSPSVAVKWLVKMNLQDLQNAISEANGFLMIGRSNEDHLCVGLAIATGRVVWVIGDAIACYHSRINTYASFKAWVAHMKIKVKP